MRCPCCSSLKSEVYNSRSTKKGTAKWRRRRCLSCGTTYSTNEACDLQNIWRITNSKDKISRPYSKLKLQFSIMRSCDHRKDKIEATIYLFEIVEQNLYNITAKNNSISNRDIAEIATKILFLYDKVAYIKYASYHNMPIEA